jgi:TRAP-type transport system periplasmic protein
MLIKGSCAVKLSRSGFVGIGASTLASIGFIRWPAGAAQFEFKCASNNALDSPIAIRQTQMWGAIQQESGGRIRIQFFPNSQLGGDAAMFSQLRLGAIQFFSTSAGQLAAAVPGADIGYLGFAFKDPDEALRVMNGPLGAFVQQEAEAKGIHLLRMSWDAGMIQISSSTHPIQTPDDLRGFKLRVVESRIAVELFKDLGAIPTTLSVNEVYTGLQTKIIDGNASGLITVEASRWYEVQKYMSITNHSWSQINQIANGDTWKSLPSDLQDIIERNNTKYAVLEQRDSKAGLTALIERLKRDGLIFNQVDQTPFRARLRPYYEYWANAYGAREWGLLERALGRKLA